MTLDGTICGTLLPYGIEKRVHRRVSFRGWAVGKHSQWLNVLLMWRLKVSKLQLCGWTDFCNVEMMSVKSGQLWSHDERTRTKIPRVS